MEQILIKFIKFGVVGFSGLLIDFTTTWVLKERVGVNRYVANSVGFTLAVISNYLLNRVWTFASTDPEVVVQFTKFLLIAVVGLLINNTVIALLERKGMNFYWAKLVAIIIVVLWNFGMNYRFAFA